MNQWEVSPYFVSPVARVLSKCVSRGAVSQEDIDAVSSTPGPDFSSVLQEAEAQLRAQRRLDKLQLELELLKLEKESADVTHVGSLSARFQVLQSFCDHLQRLLKEQNILKQRLMKPVGQTNLPIQAHLHRSVVEVSNMLLDFIESLEKKLDCVENCTRAKEQLSSINTSLTQLLAQASEVQTLSHQILDHQKKTRSLQQ